MVSDRSNPNKFQVTVVTVFNLSSKPDLIFERVKSPQFTELLVCNFWSDGIKQKSLLFFNRMEIENLQMNFTVLLKNICSVCSFVCNVTINMWLKGHESAD